MEISAVIAGALLLLFAMGSVYGVYWATAERPFHTVIVDGFRGGARRFGVSRILGQ